MTKIKKSLYLQRKNMLIRLLHKCNKVILTAFILLTAFIHAPVSAKVVVSDVTVPTLSRLHNEGKTLPDGSQYPVSGYTLTNVSSSVDTSNLPKNVVTIYDYDDATMNVTPQYYELSLNKTEFGTPGDSVKYYEWYQYENDYGEKFENIIYFKEVSAPSSDKLTISVNYNNVTKTQFTNSVNNPSLNTEGNFIGQSYIVNSSSITGGAIYNQGESSVLGNIIGSFMGNNITLNSNNYNAMKLGGGAIANEGSIANIKGLFAGNHVKSESGYFKNLYGGAIYNQGSIESISADFVGNYAHEKGSNYNSANGGAIANTGIIKSIEGNFTGNYAYMQGEYGANGGAIYSDGPGASIDIIKGVFTGNYADASYGGNGGAVYNTNNSTIKVIAADFIGNHGGNGITSLGGAIYNAANINYIIGDFIGNYAEGTRDSGGGAVFNTGQINSISGNFINNHTKTMGLDEVFYKVGGGAILNSGFIDSISGVFMNNSTTNNIDYTQSGFTLEGGAINNRIVTSQKAGKIGEISADFIGNYVKADTGSTSKYYIYATGGAINNNVTNDANLGDYKYSTGKITGNFINNYTDLRGESRAVLSSGGAIYNTSNGSQTAMGDITGVFIGNHADSYSQTGNAYAWGGAISNFNGFIGEYEDNPYIASNIKGGIINSSFYNNYASASTDTGTADAKGGAIYTNTNLNVIADNGSSVFKGNYTLTQGIKENNAIYVGNSSVMLSLISRNNGTIYLDDKIDGSSGYKLAISGDESSKVVFNNNVDNANITLEKTNLFLGNDEVLNGSESLTLNSGSLSMINGSAGTMHLPAYTLNGNTNFAADVNLENKTMDRITADTYTVNTAATLNVNYLNLLNDANQDKTYVPFAEGDLANNVAYTGLSPVAYSPIHKYQVDYLKETGEFVFTRGGGSSNPSDSYNPSVLPTPVNNQAGGYTTQLQTFNYAFQHSDTFMQIPAAQRFAIKNQNKYALSPTGDATDVGVFSPLLTKYETGGIWFKPYASFENIPLKNGPKVNNINYGTLVGFDSNLKSIKHGWERVLTGYIGYNGATQNFSGVTSNQNGGILGTTATFYKGNFFNATTLSVGATAGSNNTMYGSEDYTMLLAGIADKFGYNFEFKEGKYIIQPSMLMSYSFVNTFDYRNAAGVNIQSDPLNALQLAPGIKFIMNTKNGWQPYVGVNMVWNIMDQTKVKANDVRLPSMSIDPYIEYGVGVQRKWGERFMGYAQAMVHNGGRNGISLNGGFRWAIGKK